MRQRLLRSARSEPPGTWPSRTRSRPSGRTLLAGTHTDRQPAASWRPPRPRHIAPSTVIRPVTTHAASNQPGAPTSRADSAEVMKIPEPIIDPTTIIVASSVPSSRTKAPGSVVASLVSFVTGRAPSVWDRPAQRRRGDIDSRSRIDGERAHGVHSSCSTNALTSAMAWSSVSRRQFVSAESRVQANLLTR